MVTRLYVIGSALLTLAALHEGGVTAGSATAGMAFLVGAAITGIASIKDDDYNY